MFRSGDELSGRYRVTGTLARGAMADVYEARDLVLERRVAVKVLKGVEAGDPSRFLEELRALAQLNHECVVRLYDVGADREDPYLVMELVDGRTLRDVIEDGPLDPGTVAGLGHQIASALAHAHDAGVVHHDVKPANILIDGDWRGRLADFGVARTADRTGAHPEEILGTAAYLAPEQVAGEHVGAPADVYALGLVLLEALTGERAFPGQPAAAAVARLVREPTVPADLPPDWIELLRAMTARNPAQRPPAAAVGKRLVAFARPVERQTMPLRSWRPTTLATAGGSVPAAAVVMVALLVVLLVLLLSESAGEGKAEADHDATTTDLTGPEPVPGLQGSPDPAPPDSAPRAQQPPVTGHVRGEDRGPHGPAGRALGHDAAPGGGQGVKSDSKPDHRPKRAPGGGQGTSGRPGSGQAGGKGAGQGGGQGSGQGGGRG
jgi:eukaryotic-like serine/threonine-protein kinase